jgi:hypothetical protein
MGEEGEERALCSQDHEDCTQGGGDCMNPFGHSGTHKCSNCREEF